TVTKGLFTVDVTPPFSTRAYMVGEPILVVLHGLTGGSHENYVRAILSSVVPNTSNGGLGMRGVVLNFRGCTYFKIQKAWSWTLAHDFPGAESPLLSKKLYHVCEHT
ncbi:MAG TPA: hypothetical protein VGO47_13255, partial [Chlamydiales bacterium]|nr:hypothetical protein [Chlamydiales bacterium]